MLVTVLLRPLRCWTTWCLRFGAQPPAAVVRCLSPQHLCKSLRGRVTEVLEVPEELGSCWLSSVVLVAVVLGASAVLATVVLEPSWCVPATFVLDDS